MQEMFLKKGKYFGWLFVLLVLSVSCEDEQKSVIPSIPFTFTINLTIHNEITIPGNSIYIPNLGFGGVIVYCELPGSYLAFDATCTHEANSTCFLKNEGALGNCPCCESQFIFIGGGFPSKGPAIEPLRQYRTAVSSNSLRVYNY